MIGVLALSTLRSRTAGFVGALVALMCAAALVTACGALLETGLRAEIAPERYAGTAVVVGADQDQHWTVRKKDKTKVKSKALTERAWLPESVAGRLRAVDGVAAVVPEVTFRAVALRAGGRPLAGGRQSWGHAWTSARLTPYVLGTGRAPRSPGEVVLDAASGVRVGERVTIQTARAAAGYRVVGVTTGGFDDQASVFFSPGQARRLAGHAGRVTALGVVPEPGTDTAALARSVRSALAGGQGKVYTGDARGTLEFRDAERGRLMLVSLGGALGGTALLVAILVVAGTFTLTIQQRLREIAVLRAIAATPRQIRAMIGREALIVGVLAAVPGSAAGVAVAAWLHARFVQMGVLPDRLDLVTGPLPPIAAVAAVAAAAWIAARVSGRRAARVRPVESLADAEIEPARPGVLRVVAGLAALAAYVVLTFVLRGLDTEAAASPVTFASVVPAAAGFALLGPVVVRGAAAVVAGPLGRISAPGFLAAAGLRTRAGRLSSILTPVTLAVTMTGTILFAQTTIGHAAQEQVDSGTRAQYALTGAAGVPAAAEAAAGRVPGVTAVSAIVRTTLRVGRDKYPAQGVTTGRGTAALDLGVRSGSLAGLAGGTVALSTTAAGHRGARLGDRVPVTLGDGYHVTARLVAVYRRGLGFGDVTLPRSLVAAHVDDPAPAVVLLKTAGAAPAALSRVVRDHPGLRLLDARALRAQQRAERQTSAQASYVAMSLLIAFTAIALVNTLAMAVGDRAGELSMLRRIGGTRRQVRRMLHLETLTIVAVGVLLGTATAGWTLAAYAHGLAGSTFPYAPPLAYLGIVAAVTALTLTVTNLAARGALRH